MKERNTKDSWSVLEPFNNPQPEDAFFINQYDGNMANRMLLNRPIIERFCSLAEFEGQVVLSSMSYSRNLNYETLGNTLAFKKTDYKRKNNASDTNPLYNVTPIPTGWRIEVNDMELTQKAAKTAQKQNDRIEDIFIPQFNKVLKQGLSETLKKDKLSSEKDQRFNEAKFWTFAFPTLYIALGSLNIKDAESAFMTLVHATVYSPIFYAVMAAYDKIKLGENPRSMRNYNHYEDYLMPPLMIENVIVGNLFLKTKGKQLVKKATL